MKAIAVIMPGIIPAMKRSQMDSSARIAYIIKPRLGGIKVPNVPAHVSVPMDNTSSYLCFLISGKAMALIVTDPVSVSPDTAENPAMAPMLEIHNPPLM